MEKLVLARRQIAPVQRTRRRGIDLEAALAAVSPQVRTATLEAERALQQLGIRHVLVGGIAIGAHGYPRATKDVDFLVGDEAFERHGPIVTLRAPFQVAGVAVDSIPIPPEGTFLAAELESPVRSAGVPIISVGALVFMKLLAGRRRDQGDVVELVKAGIDEEQVRSYLQQHAPDQLLAFSDLVSTAEQELE